MRWRVERRMELDRMVVEPATPDTVIRPARRDEGPELRAVPEYPQVGQLVNHDGVERLGRRQEQPPRERQATAPRSTAPARSRVAQGHRPGLDAQGLRMRHDRGRDRAARPLTQPALEDRGIGAPIRRDAMDHKLVGEGDNVGSPGARHGRHDANAMEPATERDHAAVRGAATASKLCDEGSLTIEVTAQPWLALGEERDCVLPAISPTGPGRHGHDHAPLGM